jgi:hypothetical protein
MRGSKDRLKGDPHPSHLGNRQERKKLYKQNPAHDRLVQYRIVYRLPLALAATSVAFHKGAESFFFAAPCALADIDLGQATFPIQCVEYVKPPGTGMDSPKAG